MADYPITRGQISYIHILLDDLGFTTTPLRHAILIDIVGNPDINSLSSAEASEVIKDLKYRKEFKRGDL